MAGAARGSALGPYGERAHGVRRAGGRRTPLRRRPRRAWRTRRQPAWARCASARLAVLERHARQQLATRAHSDLQVAAVGLRRTPVAAPGPAQLQLQRVGEASVA